jgi:hypothetical protein
MVMALALLVVAGVTLAKVLRPAEQPIPFNHQLHITEVGLGCTDCHTSAETGVRATIPKVELCGDCHQEAMTGSAGEAILLAHVEAGKAIPWHQVSWIPQDVYFSHRRHVAIAGLECETCHGAVADRATPLTRPLRPVTMKGCIDCHRRAGASSDCISCHR